MIEIILTKGKVALIDNEDFDLVSNYKWHAVYNGGTWYAETLTRKSEGCKVLKMHRLIMYAKKGQMIDHKDHNGLNNQKINLRFATNAENQRNQKAQHGTSVYKGVYKHKSRWAAQITINKKRTYLGIFKTEIGAAKAYDSAAIQHFGEYAGLNFLE